MLQWKRSRLEEFRRKRLGRGTKLTRGLCSLLCTVFQVGISEDEGGEDIDAVAADGPEDGCHVVAVGGFDGGVGGEEDVRVTGVV